MRIVDLSPLRSLRGFIGACLLDFDTGQVLGTEGDGPPDIELVAASNTEVMRANHRTMSSLGMQEDIEEILISLDRQYHVMRPLGPRATGFLYLVLDRQRANLAIVLKQLKEFAPGVDIWDLGL